MTTLRVLFVIAWRNLWRNARRTLLTASTISVGLGMLLVFVGLTDGLHRQMQQSAVHLGGAHVAVQRRDYQARKAVELTLPATELQRLEPVALRAGGVRATLLPRVFASGLVSSADGSSGVSITGIDASREPAASLLDEKIVAGRFLAAGDGNSAVIGRGVASKLKLAPGEKCVLMAQGPGSPDIQSVLVRVVGVIQTGTDDLDQAAVLVPLATAQALLGLAGRIHQVGVVLADPGETERAVRLFRAGAAGNLEVLPWGSLMPSLRDFIRLDVAGMFIIDTVFLLIIAFLVANTLLVSVLERRREFALLDAVGLTPPRRFLLIMLEALWVGILAAACGSALGWAADAWFSRKGLSLAFFTDSGFSAAGTPVDLVVYSALTPARTLLGVSLIFLLTLLLALIPAWRAATDADPHLLGQG